MLSSVGPCLRSGALDESPRHDRSRVRARAGPDEYARSQFFAGPFAWIAVAPLRFQDLNLPGAWAYIFLAPFAVLPFGFLVERIGGPSFLVLMMIATVPAVLLNMVLMILPGTKGPNRYGEEPAETRRVPPYVPPPPPPPSIDDKLAEARREIDSARHRLTPDL